MNADKAFNVLGSLVVVAGITTLVVHGTGTRAAFTGFGDAFSNMLRAAQGLNS